RPPVRSVVAWFRRDWRAFTAASYFHLPKSINFATGGFAFGATSTRSKSASTASRNASSIRTIPTCSPSGPTNRTSGTRMRSFTLGSLMRDLLVEVTLVVANSQWLTSPGRHKKSLPVQTVEAQTSTNVVHYVQQILPWKSEYLGYLTTRSTIRRQVGGIPPLVIRPITITVFSDQDNCALVSHSYSLHETFVDLHHALTRYAKLNI